MLPTKSYTILEKFTKNAVITTPLCILKTDSILQNYNKLLQIINNHPDTEFWLATAKQTREIIEKANLLGIKNILSLPIDENIIHAYFNKLLRLHKVSEFVSEIDLSNMNVAVVDDNDMNVKLLAEILKELNVNVYSFTEPEGLVKILEEEKFDLFLLDILMPNISGFELANMIKQSKLNSGASIIFVTAMSNLDAKMHGYDLGACSYIEKPYNVELVKTQIYNLLKKQVQNSMLNSRKENFVAMLTHDLKSPINAEINALELLVKKRFGEMSDCQNEIIGSVLNSAKYMKHITDQILSFYKCNQSYVKLNKEEAVFEEIVSKSVLAMKFLYEEKHQQIHIENQLGKKKILIDVIEINRVINNLISNAVEYSPENSVINITLSEKDNYFVFKIKDSGYGIDIENLDTVFDEYMSLAKKQKRVGFGLGLNICKTIVEAHNGKISIDSEVGKGTTISFSIPRGGK